MRSTTSRHREITLPALEPEVWKFECVVTRVGVEVWFAFCFGAMPEDSTLSTTAKEVCSVTKIQRERAID